MNTIDTSWSRLLNTELGFYVAEHMDDHERYYHNMNHVHRLYMRAKEWKLEYDPDLDAAILLHDLIYDAQPDKELRTAEAVKQLYLDHPDWFAGIGLLNTNLMILNTVDHIFNENVNPWMIRLDLADLADPEARYTNFWLLIDEGTALYQLSRLTIAANTEKFMTQFAETIMENSIMDVEFNWEGVYRGCNEVRAMARAVKDSYLR